nr:MAG: hypothetical protein 2 [Heilongjiang sediment noda-like virus 2]
MSKYSARTLESVEKSLTKMSLNRPSNPAKAYLACRYAPFEGHSMGVPDGNGRNTTLRDYYSAFDIVCDESGFDACIVPWVPIQTLLMPGKAGGSMTINGFNYVRPTDISFPNAVGTYPVWSANTSNTFSQLGNRPDSMEGNVDAHIATGRIVTVGYKLMYTGKASTCQGIIQADLFTQKLDVVETNAGPVRRFLWDGTQAATDWLANTVRLAAIDLDVTSTNLAPSTVVSRPEHGLTGVLSRRTSSKTNTFKPYYELGLVPVYDVGIPSTNASFTAYPSIANLPSQFHYNPRCPTISLLDDDFNVCRIRVRTGEANNYRLEVFTCVQFEQTPSFPLLSLTHGPTMREEAILEKDDALNGTLVAGAPLGDVPFNLGKVAALPQRVRRPKRSRNQAGSKRSAPATNGNGGKRRRRRRAKRRAKAAATRGGW